MITFLEAHTHENIEPTYFKLLNRKNCESITTKCKLNKNKSNEENDKNNVLNDLRLKNLEKVKIGHINIISLIEAIC